MIKLTRSPKPPELTSALEKELTDRYKKTKESVWNLDFIKKGLLAYSSNKCCYCEANINEESKYLEVEHFHPKDKYEDEVMDWNNLLPSCKKCNGTKNDHDTKNEPIIDPAAIDPRNHLTYWRYRFRGKDDLGKLTVTVLDLNNADRLVAKRFKIGNAIQDKLEQLNELLDEYMNGQQTSTRRKNRVINGTKDLMREGLATSIYSASTATILLSDPEFGDLESKLLGLSLWDAELIQLKADLSSIAF